MSKMSEMVNLSWNDFQSATIKTFKNLHSDFHFTDVTLACGDGQQMLAHKAILSSCSTFFKNIFIKNPHKHPLIYLNGFNIKELRNIIKFVYTGEVEIDKDQINEFLKLANYLEIDGLKKGPDTNEKGVDANFPSVPNQSKIGLKLRKDIVEETNKVEEYALKDTDPIEESQESVDIKEDPETKVEEIISDYSCDQCMFESSSGQDLMKHRKYEHSAAERCFNCIQCGKQFATQQNLKIHQVVHSGWWSKISLQ